MPDIANTHRGGIHSSAECWARLFAIMRAAQERVESAIDKIKSVIIELHRMKKQSRGAIQHQLANLQTNAASVYDELAKARDIMKLNNFKDTMTVFMEMPLWAVSFKANDGKDYVTMTVAPNKTMAMQNVQRCNSDLQTITGIDHQDDVLINSDHIKARAEAMEAEAIAENLKSQEQAEQ